MAKVFREDRKNNSSTSGNGNYKASVYMTHNEINYGLYKDLYYKLGYRFNVLIRTNEINRDYVKQYKAFFNCRCVEGDI